MGDIRIRAASAEDVAELAMVGQEVFVHTYGAISDAADVEAHVKQYFSEPAIALELEKADVLYFMAVRGDQCAGLLKLRSTEVPENVSAETALEVQQVYVRADFQRMGVGKLLMDCAVDVAQEQNVGGLWLSVWSEAPWATTFYRQYGFSEKGEVPFRIGETDYVDYVMWLPISS